MAGRRLLLAAVMATTFSVMFSISVVGPLLDALASSEGVPLGPRPNTSLGLIFSLGGLSLALLQVPMALLARGRGYRPLIAAGSLGVGASVALMGYVGGLAGLLGLRGLRIGGLGWDGSTLLLAVLRTLQGAAAAATWPLLMALLSVAVPGESLGAAMGAFGASFGLGMSLGPTLGPALAASAGIHAPFLLAGALAAASAVLAAKLPEARGGGAFRGGGGLAWSPGLAALSLAAFSLLYAMGALVVIYPRFMRRILGLGLGDVAAAMALAGLTFTLLQPLTGRLADRVDKRVLAAAGLPVAGLSALTAVMAGGRAGVYASMLAFGLSGAVAFPAASALVGLIAPRGMEGVYMGVYNGMLSLGVTVSPIVVGALSDSLGYRAAFATAPALALASLALIVVTLRGYPPSPPPRPSAATSTRAEATAATRK